MKELFEATRSESRIGEIELSPQLVWRRESSDQLYLEILKYEVK